MSRVPRMPDLGDPGADGTGEMAETVKIDAVNGNAGEERKQISSDHPIRVINGHEQNRKVDEMVDQNLGRSNVPFAVNKDGLVQYQSQQGTEDG